MKNITIVGLLTVLIVCSCSQSTTKSIQQHDNDSKQLLDSTTGLKIEYGLNQGIRANDALGITNPFIYTTSIITNDSTTPIHLQIALSREYEFPAFCSDDNYKYKVVLLPAELTPDTATLRNTIVSGSEEFFEVCLDKPFILNKTLKPSEYQVITIGTLYPSRSNCEVIPRAVFSHDKKDLYHTCDSQVNQALSTNPQLEIAVKLEFYNQRKFIAPEDHCTIIPCGQISYPDR